MSNADMDEIPRTYEAVTLRTEEMDPALAAALFDDDAFEDCEEIDDDFCIEAETSAD